METNPLRKLLHPFGYMAPEVPFTYNFGIEVPLSSTSPVAVRLNIGPTVEGNFSVGLVVGSTE